MGRRRAPVGGGRRAGVGEYRGRVRGWEYTATEEGQDRNEDCGGRETGNQGDPGSVPMA